MSATLRGTCALALPASKIRLEAAIHIKLVRIYAINHAGAFEENMFVVNDPNPMET